jgi:hypothetical protein
VLLTTDYRWRPEASRGLPTGRWTFVDSQWFWVPERARTRPLYSPALVAFIPLQTESIGWVPLGPGDPYAPRYYDPNWTPRYLTRTQLVQDRAVNLNVPGAVTVVNVRFNGSSIGERLSSGRTTRTCAGAGSVCGAQLRDALGTRKSGAVRDAYRFAMVGQPVSVPETSLDGIWRQTPVQRGPLSYETTGNRLSPD